MSEHAIYIGKWPDCGCVTAACVDDPKHRKDTAKFVSDLLKDGRIVERVEASEFDKTVTLVRCPHRSRGKK